MGQIIKLKELEDRDRNLVFLRMITNKKLTLNYQKAQLLAKNERSYFVPFNFDEHKQGRGNKAELYYFINELYSLEDYLSWGISARRLNNLMAQIVRMFTLCEGRGFYTSNILLDIKYCYVYAQANLLKFVYLPINGYASEDRALQDFLLALTEAAQPKNSEAARYQAKLLDFLRRMDVFSLFKLKGFIEPLEGGEDVFSVAAVTSGEMQKLVTRGASRPLRARLGSEYGSLLGNDGRDDNYRDFVHEITGGQP
ncbi:MAG: DUF6382 domain-containing protein [Coriobacteriales bacterium]|jgi:hypothetical protein|nr:DUF6382 domain-containing protein [Coriobacteriales bacterium]